MIRFCTFLLLAFLSTCWLNAQTSESYRWGKVMLGGGGAVPTIIAHPKVPTAIFSTHDVCGPNRWNESLQRFEYSLSFPYWIQPQGSAGCECLTFDPNDPYGNTALLTLADTKGFNQPGYLLRTTNRGISWEYTNFRPVAGSEQFNARYHIQYDPNNSNVVYYAARNGGVYQSIDGGINFNKTSCPDGDVFDLDRPKSNTGIRKIIVNPYLGVVPNPLRSRVLYAEYGKNDWANYMIESTDGAQTWHKSDMPLGSKYEVAKGGRVYIAGKNKAGYWENSRYYEFPVGGNSISVDPSNENRIVIYKNLGGDQYSFYYSVDKGLSWKTLTPGYQNYPAWYRNEGGCTAPQGGCSNPVDGSFTFDASGRLWYSDWYQVWRNDSIDLASGKIQFTGAVLGEEETVNIGDGLSSPWGGNCKVMIGTGDVGGFAVTDITRWPEKTALQPYHNIVGMDWAGNIPNMLVFVATSGWGWDHIGWGGYSEDGGITSSYFKNRPNGGTMLCSRVTVNASGTRIFWYCNTGLYYSDNKGDTWIRCTDLSFGYESIFDWSGFHAIAADRFNEQLIYLVSNDKLYRSDDKGISWNLVNSKSIGSVMVSPIKEGEVWVSSWNSSGGLIKRSTDKGVTFSNVTTASDVRSVAFGKGPTTDTASLYMIGKANGISGIYRSDNYGLSWIHIDDLNNFPHPNAGNFIMGDGQVFGRVYIGTHSGTWVGSLPSVCDTCKPDNQLPRVSITMPSYTQLNEGEDITVAVQASDPDGKIIRVELFLNDSLTGTDSISPYTFQYTNLQQGILKFTARAWDSQDTFSLAKKDYVVRKAPRLAYASPLTLPVSLDGMRDTSYRNISSGLVSTRQVSADSVRLDWTSSWNSAGLFLYVSFTDSSNYPFDFAGRRDTLVLNITQNLNFLRPEQSISFLLIPVDTTILLAGASDSLILSGKMAVTAGAEGYSLEVLIDASILGTSLVSRSYLGLELIAYLHGMSVDTPGIMYWNSPPAGNLFSLSSPGLLYLQPINNAPAIRITAPFNNRLYDTRPLLVSIFADASDNDGMVTRVDFFANDQLIGTDLTSPFSIGTSTLPDGSYQLKAVATDNDNCSTTSAIVNILVDIPSGLNNENSREQAAVYPNPVHDRVFFSVPVSATLYSLQGKLLRSVTASSSMELVDIPAGFYLLRTSQRSVEKLLKY